MKQYHSNVETLIWRDGALHLIDQRQLPHQQTFVVCERFEEVVTAIQTMVVRGAPAIGVAAAYGAVLAAMTSYREHGDGWHESFLAALHVLGQARPTAVNLDWALKQMAQVAVTIQNGDPGVTLLAKAKRLHELDLIANHAMGDFGATLLATGDQVITHCNAGALATAGYGTALGVIRSAFRDGHLAHVYATETRPWLQGARLTAWELATDEIPVTLMADHAAAQLMAKGNIQWVITGADRVAANGDVANKIGTYALALIARAQGVKMMVVAPTSTIDMNTASGAEIPIEQRAGDELLSVQGHAIAAQGVPAINPVFDVTPAELIDVLVTEKGIINHPDRAQISALF